MKRLGICFIFFIAAVSLFADSSVAWEGRAAVGSADNFPAGGSYAQSRVFSKGEIVDVYNTANGKTSSVVITGSTDLSGVLILLSPSAAQNLDITGGYDTVVRISRKNDYVKEGTLAQIPSKASYDADSNPRAALKDDLYYTESNKPSDYKPPVYDPEPEVLPEPVQEPVVTRNTPVFQLESVPVPKVNEYTPQVTQRNEPPVEEIKEPVKAVETKDPEPKIEKQRPENRNKNGITAYEYALLPTAEQQPTYDNTRKPQNTQCPPVQPPVKTQPQEQNKDYRSKVPANMPYPELLISDYEYGKFYVQLAVYREFGNMKNIVNKYRGKYPISIKASDRTSGAYEMLIGPLSEDEYNTVLNKFRKDGFIDAFVKFKK